MTAVTTIQAVLTKVRTTIAALSLARTATEKWIPYDASLPFRQAPASKREHFQVTAVRSQINHAYGHNNIKEQEFQIVIELGHAPFGKDNARGDWIAGDANKIVDTLEAQDWFLPGMMGVFYVPQSANTDKTNPNWWITELTFRCIIFSAIV